MPSGDALTLYPEKPFMGGGANGVRRWRVDAVAVRPRDPDQPAPDDDLLSCFVGARDRQERPVPLAILRGLDLAGGLDAALAEVSQCR
ncbi:hypothetical protein [Sphingomonas bacterium]|uniref:hypothetical protein n=1 Tax=Sphingomonas bacterium TaxID=1895847 RepID=UPI001576FC61|nr:hypothetical protein [Sphingomonas bacterium]